MMLRVQNEMQVLAIAFSYTPTAGSFVYSVINYIIAIFSKL